MKIGTFATFMSPIATPQMIGQFAKDAESLGLDSIWVGEHVVLFDEMEFPYPGSADGRLPVPEGGGMLDSVATFGYLAACTETIRFGTGITLIPQRNPIYTAKEFATLDWLTGGRIDFGIGVGWCKEEVIACGYDFASRGKRCDEILEIFRALWTQDRAEYHGEFYDFPPCRLDPKPVQSPMPIIVGGHSPAGFKRAAKHGNGWYGFQLDVEHTARVIEQLDVALAQEGRTRDENFELVITPPYQVTPDMIKAYQDLGVDHLVLHQGSQKPERIQSRFAEFEQLMKAVG